MSNRSATVIQFTRMFPPTLVSVSESVEDLLGYTSAQFLGGDISWPSLVHTDDQDIVDKLFSAALAPLLTVSTSAFVMPMAASVVSKGNTRWTLPASPHPCSACS